MDAFIAGNNEGFKKKRDLVMSKLEEIGIKPAVLPTGAFYVFPVVERYFGMFTPAGAKIENAMDVCLHILEQEKPLALVPGGAFGEPRCLRIPFSPQPGSQSIGADKSKLFQIRLDKPPNLGSHAGVATAVQPHTTHWAR